MIKSFAYSNGEQEMQCIQWKTILKNNVKLFVSD